MLRHSMQTAFLLANAMTWPLALPAASQDADDLVQLRQTALAQTNASRQEAGLGSLSHSDLLDRTAQGHAEDMLARDYYDHVSPEGETPHDRFLAAGGNSWAVSGENIATCTGCAVPPDADRVRAFHEGWMQSPGHRQNILSKGFDSFGFGIASEDGTIYAVQTFSGPGESGGAGDALKAEKIPQTALKQINDHRKKAGLEPLQHDSGLDKAAERVLDQDAETLPDNIFDYLPKGSTGWTSLRVKSATLGGSGADVTAGNLSTVISDWADTAGQGSAMGGATATHLGFAAKATGDGRLSAIALFGGK